MKRFSSSLENPVVSPEIMGCWFPKKRHVIQMDVYSPPMKVFKMFLAGGSRELRRKGLSLVCFNVHPSFCLMDRRTEIIYCWLVLLSNNYFCSPAYVGNERICLTILVKNSPDTILLITISPMFLRFLLHNRGTSYSK